MHSQALRHQRHIHRGTTFEAFGSKTPCAIALAVLLTLAPSALPGEHLKTESRAPFLHRIPIRDTEGHNITMPPLLDDENKPQEARANPYSPAHTCGKCHEYDMIGGGWHFNAGKDGVQPGRAGEPWLLTDAATRTQLPLSYRGWPGTFKPAQIGMSDFDFATAFARHLPGGGAAEPAKDKIDAKHERQRRWLVTGTLEIDCMICHEANGRYDHESRLRALLFENLKWLPAIAAGHGTLGLGRSSKSVADKWDEGEPAPENAMTLKYDRSKLDPEQNATFEVERKGTPGNCYYCHTSESQMGDARWHSDQDVHLRAGMNCADCHRHGVDHNVVRGYEGEIKDRALTAAMLDMRAKLLLRGDAALGEAGARQRAEQQLKEELQMIGTLSCRGCHYGSDGAPQAAARLGGRLGAPVPVHKGLPPVHLEKLSCTACHSGPFPAGAPQVVHTSMAHKLGVPGPARAANTPPVIVQPVFLRGHDGKLAPHKMVWPSYWGRLKDGQVRPLLPAEVAPEIRGKVPAQPPADIARDPYNTQPLSDAQISAALEALAGDAAQGEAMFVAAGKLYRLVRGALTSAEHAAAKPYAWALAHDVRSASQALGVRGCSDCHSDESPVYFANVTSRGPVEAKNSVIRPMWAMRGEDKTLPATFAFTFKFRPLLKYITFGSALVVLGVLLSFGLVGLHSFLNRNNKP